jgi:tetratricopeptide (TPR) repeat protein
MKCLDKDRNRRYETANGLAMDLRRYLADEPVLAGPPSPTYRMRKFLRRHRGPVLAATALVVLLVAGVIGTSIGMIRAQQAEAQAVEERNAKERARAEAAASAVAAQQQTELARLGFDEARRAVDRSFTLVSESRLLNVPGLQPLRKSLLAEARTYYRTFAQRWSEEPSLRRDLANATFRVAVITAQIGDKQQALADYQEAARLCRAVQALAPDDVEIRRSLATCANNTGNILMELDRYPEALAAFERSEDATRRLLEEHPGQPELKQDLALVRGNLALVLNHLGRRDQALTHLNAAIAFYQRELAAGNDPSRQHHALAGLLNSLGAIRRSQKRYAEAATAFRDAAAQERRALQANPLDHEYRAWLGNHCFNLALLCESYLKRLDEALAARREAAEVWDKLAADNPAVTEYRAHLAQAHLDLGNLLIRMPGQGDPAPCYAKARALLEPLTREYPDVARYQSSLGAVLSESAGLLMKTGKHAEARALLEQAVRHQERAVKLSPDVEQYRRFLAAHYMNLTRIFLHMKKPDSVIWALERAVPLQEWLVHARPDPATQRLELAQALNTLGLALAQKQRHDAAFAAHRRAVAVVEEMVNAQPGDVENIDTLSSAYAQLANDLVKAGRVAEAEALRERQVEFWSRLRHEKRAAPRVALEYVAALFERGELAYNRRDMATALTWFRKLRAELDALDRERPGDDQVQHYQSMCLKGIGDMHFLRSEPAEAVAAWEAALVVYRDKLLPSDPQRASVNGDIGGILHNLGRCHADAGRHEKALALCQDAIKYQKVAYAQNPTGSRPWLDHHYVLQAAMLRKLQRPAEAAAASRERARLWSDQPAKRIDAAGDIARCVPLAGMDAQLAKALADEAMALIAQAIAQGYRDGKRLQADAALAPLRERADFRKLLAELAAKKAPAAP